jgi:hypothetical protein
MVSKFFTPVAPFGRILGAARPHSAPSRRMASSASGGWPYFTIQFGRRRVHRGAAIQIERILTLADIPVFGKLSPSM